MRLLVRVVILVVLVGGVVLLLVPPGQAPLLDRVRNQLISEFSEIPNEAGVDFKAAPPRTVYRWKDEQGVIHYSDQLRDGIEQEAIELRDNLGRLPAPEPDKAADESSSESSGQYSVVLKESLDKAKELKQQLINRYEVQRKELDQN
ncbi:DUF4124 domain-containing protein [Aestuariirhabdus sp. LZHN29]|uniref:DUF4124 domain-containing protein n=1 Tax=Aestuariirhabdus sp. LZHN29 TaxID=3417462 RepID=UPI003CEE1F16